MSADAWILETKEAISRLERLAAGESTTPAQIAAQSETIKACMEKLATLSPEDTAAHKDALNALRQHLDTAMDKLQGYQDTIKQKIQTNAIRARANKQYGGPK